LREDGEVREDREVRREVRRRAAKKLGRGGIALLERQTRSS